VHVIHRSPSGASDAQEKHQRDRKEPPAERKSWPRHTAKTLENGANFYPIKSTIWKEYTNQRMRFTLGPRVSRVLCNIQHGFPFRQFRGVLRSQCHRCFSLCIYYIVVSVSVIPVDIYSNRVSIARFTVYRAVLFNIVLFARVACTQDICLQLFY